MSKETLKNWQGTIAVVGVDWGDSGKGRLVDDLSQRADIVARFNGGSNTGHTVKNQMGEFALHIMPSGIFNENATCLVGRNVAVDLESLAHEMNTLDSAGVSYKNLIIDEQASLTMPWHKLLDGLREKEREEKGAKIGTTGKGVGPTYADRTQRNGLLVKDLFLPDFRQKLKSEVEFYNEHFNLNLNQDELFKTVSVYAQKIKKYVGQTVPILLEAQKQGKNILFEGAQGIFLDIDFGTYPFVTSSNPGVVGIWRCFDFHPKKLDQVIGITKAYMTRVGEGPMPTLIKDENSQIIIEKGKEKGTTTGRVRRPGWLDLVLIKEAVEVNSITALAITKLDILSHLKKIRVCTGYNINGRRVGYLAHDADFLQKVEPIYNEFEGWHKDITNVRNFDDLPANAGKFIRFIEQFLCIAVKFISVGPERGQVIYA